MISRDTFLNIIFPTENFQTEISQISLIWNATSKNLSHFSNTMQDIAQSVLNVFKSFLKEKTNEKILS
jgi:hypothetical protein